MLLVYYRQVSESDCVEEKNSVAMRNPTCVCCSLALLGLLAALPLATTQGKQCTRAWFYFYLPAYQSAGLLTVACTCHHILMYYDTWALKSPTSIVVMLRV